MASANRTANPHANVLSFINAQLPFHDRYAAEGRRIIEPYLESYKLHQAAKEQTGSIARSELHSEGSRESTSVRPRGVVARMRTKEDRSMRTLGMTDASPPLITKKEMEEKMASLGKENVVEEPARKRQNFEETKVAETKTRRSILKPSESHNANLGDGLAARTTAKTVKDTGPTVITSNDKRLNSTADLAPLESDRDARKRLLTLRLTRNNRLMALIYHRTSRSEESSSREGCHYQTKSG